MPVKTRDDLRNVAIIAHVDHGKTTLVDAMLWQSGAFTEHQAESDSVRERVMDSMDLEREKGITILAKNTAVRHGDVTINIIDTPGHADFGGEVERGLSMVDGVAAARRRVARDRCRRPGSSCARRCRSACPSSSSSTRSTGPTRASPRSSTRRYELFLDLDADEHQIDFPIVYCPAKAGRASLDRPGDGEMPDSPDLEPLFETLIVRRSPRRRTTESAPLQAHVTNLDASPYLGRLALCRVHNGTMKKGQPVAWCRADGTDRAGEAHRAARHRGARAGADRARPARATSSPSPASPRSPSARRSPTPTTRGRCRSSRSTSRASR